MKNIKWAYGVTTIPQRRDTLLAHTIKRLAEAGFPHPRLFVDGVLLHECSYADYYNKGCDVTCHYPRVRPYANWLLGITELYLSNPEANLFAMFQDDITLCTNLRPYLEQTCGEDGYYNLYTAPSNQSRSPARKGWYVASILRDDVEVAYRQQLNNGMPRGSGPDWQQTGRGALALVFSRKAVMALLTAKHTIDKPQSPDRGWRNIDGGIVTAMNQAGFTEYVHNPSLVQHTGIESSIDHNPSSDGKSDNFVRYKWPADVCATSFPGEQYNAMDLLNGGRSSGGGHIRSGGGCAVL